MKETAWIKKFSHLKLSGDQEVKTLLPSWFTTPTINKTLTQKLGNWKLNSNSVAFFFFSFRLIPQFIPPINYPNIICDTRDSLFQLSEDYYYQANIKKHGLRI